MIKKYSLDNLDRIAEEKTPEEVINGISYSKSYSTNLLFVSRLRENGFSDKEIIKFFLIKDTVCSDCLNKDEKERCYCTADD